MLKTNTKKARANIMAYIRQDLDYLMERDSSLNEQSSDNEVCKAIWNIFDDETFFARLHERSNYKLFKGWAQGLALGGLFCYYYNRSAVEDLGDILEETEEERNRFTESQAEEKLTWLIYREIMKRAFR